MSGSVCSTSACPMRPICCVDSHGRCVNEITDVTCFIDQFQEHDVSCDDVRVALLPGHKGPKVKAAPTYFVSEHCEMLGSPILVDKDIFFLRPRESIQEATVALHSNGFRVTMADGKTPLVSCAWSPFALVEKCQVKAQHKDSSIAIFKLTVFAYEGSDRCYYFATKGRFSYQQRERWVTAFKERVEEVTISLFPPHAICVRPLRGVLSTSRRIMAGYLIRCVSVNRLTVVYCELQSYTEGCGRLSIYNDESCTGGMSSLRIVASTPLSSRRGVHCTTFGVEGNRFSARTVEEKELWLRAIGNVKVKLMYETPDPSSQDIALFRSCILDRVDKLEAVQKELGPMLPRAPGVPDPTSLCGDAASEPEAPDVKQPGMKSPCREESGMVVFTTDVE